MISFLIFPGLLFSVICGMIASFIDRKITARIQWRKGPPLLQPLYDIVKLFGKEIIIPKSTSPFTFLILPFLSVIAVALVGSLNGVIVKNSIPSFSGDLIVAIYLMMVPGVCMILAGGISSNPLSMLGASREIKLFISYEIGFILSMIVVIIKTGGSIRLLDILDWQVNNIPLIYTLSGFLSFIVSFFVVSAKLGIVPFDIAEAEQEIIAGTLIEYSGAALGMFKLSRMMMLFVYPMFLVRLFWYSSTGSVFMDSIIFVLKYIVVLLLLIVLRNTNPRLRVDQVVRFFWKYIILIAVVAIYLAGKGV
jgi:NADH-quinone oxidoreductase subunit H